MSKITKIVRNANDPKRIQIQAEINTLMKKHGFKAVAASLSDPVKITMDLKATARPLFVFRGDIPQGQPMFYETDLIRTPAIVAAPGAGVYGIDASPTKVFLNEKSFQSKVFVQRQYKYTMAYDVWARAQERLSEGLAIREDLQLYSLMSVAANSGLGHPPVVTAGKLDLSTISRAQTLLKNYTLPASTIVYNPSGERGVQATSRLNIDEKGMQEIRETGFVGNIYGATRMINTVLTEPGTAFVATDPQLLGQYFVRADQLVDEIPALERARFGFIGYHLYGIAIHNAHGVVEVQFNAAA